MKPAIGDRVLLFYGPMHGEATATITERRVSSYGAQWVLALDDGGTDSLTSYNGQAEDLGNGAYRRLSHAGIGAYKIIPHR